MQRQRKRRWERVNMDQAGGYDEDGKSEHERIYRQYPWLKYSAVLPTLHKGQIRTSHMYFLVLTALERYVSAQVFVLRKKPKEANDFLRKVSQWIWGMRIDHYRNRFRPGLQYNQFYPVFGRLLKHMIVITLASEKLRRKGAAKVAFELYNFMKDLLHKDIEFVLDVILTSALTHERNLFAPDKLGYQVLARVIMDYHHYCGSPAKKMKYCWIATLLSRYSLEGYQFIYRNMPVIQVDPDFAKFLTITLGYEKIPLELKLKSATFKTVVLLLEQSGRSEKVKELSKWRMRIKPKFMIRFSVMDRKYKNPLSFSSAPKRNENSARRSVSTFNYYNELWSRKRKAPTPPPPSTGTLRMVIQPRTQKVIYCSTIDNSITGADAKEPFTARDERSSDFGMKVPKLILKLANIQQTLSEDSLKTDETAESGAFSNQMTSEADVPTNLKITVDSQLETRRSPQVPLDISIKSEEKECIRSEMNQQVSKADEPIAVLSTMTLEAISQTKPFGFEAQVSLQIPMDITCKAEGIFSRGGNEHVSEAYLLTAEQKRRPGSEIQDHLDFPKLPETPLLDIKPKTETTEPIDVVTISSPTVFCISTDSDSDDIDVIFSACDQISFFPIQESPLNPTTTNKNSGDYAGSVKELEPVIVTIPNKHKSEIEPEVASNPPSPVKPELTTSVTQPQILPPPRRRRGRPRKSDKVSRESDVISKDNPIPGVLTTSTTQPKPPLRRSRRRLPRHNNYNKGSYFDNNVIPEHDPIHEIWSCLEPLQTSKTG